MRVNPSPFRNENSLSPTYSKMRKAAAKCSDNGLTFRTYRGGAEIQPDTLVRLSPYTHEVGTYARTTDNGILFSHSGKTLTLNYGATGVEESASVGIEDALSSFQVKVEMSHSLKTSCGFVKEFDASFVTHEKTYGFVRYRWGGFFDSLLNSTKACFRSIGRGISNAVGFLALWVYGIFRPRAFR